MQKSHFYLKLSDTRISVTLENKILGQYHDTFTKITFSGSSLMGKRNADEYPVFRHLQ